MRQQILTGPPTTFRDCQGLGIGQLLARALMHRCRWEGGTVYAEQSVNGQSWTSIDSRVPTNSMASAQAGIYAGYGGTEPSPGTAIWDNFDVPPSTTPAALRGHGALSATATSSAALVAARLLHDKDRRRLRHRRVAN